jgi:hypothetical protein
VLIHLRLARRRQFGFVLFHALDDPAASALYPGAEFLHVVLASFAEIPDLLLYLCDVFLAGGR